MLNRKMLFFVFFVSFFFLHRINGTTPIEMGQPIPDKKSVEVGQDSASSQFPKSQIYEFSEKEQQIIDVLKKVRVQRKIRPLDVNPRISEAIKQEMEKIFNSTETSLTSQQIEKRLNELVSYLGGVSFIMKGESIDKLVPEFNRNEKLQKEIADSSNLTMALGLAHLPDTNRIYCLIYLCRYSIEWKISPAGGEPVGFEPNSPIFNWEEFDGKCNGKYLKYEFYKSIGLSVAVKEGDKISTGVVEADKNGNFSFSISFLNTKWEDRRLTILARNSPSEAYSLTDVLGIRGIFPK